jgi:excisionase family DNA binding protein
MKRDDNMDFRQLLFPWSPRYTVSTKSAASLLKVSVKTVCRMIADGALDAEKCCPDKINSPWRVNLESVEKHLKQSIESISSEQAAEILDISLYTLCEMLKNGELTGHKYRSGPSPWRVNYASVRQHLQRLSTMAGSAHEQL